MNDLVDLHVHSNRSCDGDFTPAELIQFAKEQSFRAIAISDHDTVAAYPEAVEIGRGDGVEIIPSVELTTLFDGREFHVLLPFVNWESEVVADLTSRVTRSRFREGRRMMRGLPGTRCALEPGRLPTGPTQQRWQREIRPTCMPTGREFRSSLVGTRTSKTSTSTFRMPMGRRPTSP